ncbi:MAG: serine/threonine protein kinase [Myxococcales bacterium]|nr:serine/threonine protein kinase [Myxococcales bacterium]MCB9717871.1 serine/threonine protein kinase [Myxococcales bacterium]
MSVLPEPSASSVSADPLRHVAPVADDVEARRARAAIESRLFSGPPQPVCVGRYRVEGRLGAGGMGVVYRAHDPELARDVAVKVMNADAAGTKDPATARARLVREARAMARLAHPNVIHVYDVGTVEDGVFIAMELVDGRSLSVWLAEEQPPWREVLHKVVDAGRGLAAAHAAGVIHRDFKPENVLVGEDGRVRVVDFGLAGGPAALDTGSQESELDRDTGDLHGPSGSLTRTGTLLGTPKYMAPEQESGAVANARSDQFSFCVALYEALYGYPPFAGDTISEYRDNVRRGRVLDPPTGTKVRPWVHALLVRGLAIDPADRHPALDPLLDRLEEALVEPEAVRRRRRRARLLTAMVGTTAVLLAVGLGWWLAPDDARSEVMAATTAPRETSEPGASLPEEPITARTVDVVADPLAPLPDEPELDETTGGADSEDGGGSDLATPSSVATSTTGTTGPGPSEATTGAAASSRSRRRRDGGTCYFHQDRFTFLQRQRRYERFVQGKDGRCYDCDREAPDYRRAQLSPSDCSRYYLCVGTSEDQCSG